MPGEPQKGVLLLLVNGQVGLLSASGPLIVGDWRTVPGAASLAKEGDSYYLLDSAGERKWNIDPQTGTVQTLGSGKPQTQSQPSAGPTGSSASTWSFGPGQAEVDTRWSARPGGPPREVTPKAV